MLRSFVLSLCLVFLFSFAAQAEGQTSTKLNDEKNLEFQVDGETSIMMAKPGAVCNSASEGAMYYDKTKHTIVYCNGSEWKSPGGISLDDLRWHDMTASRAAGPTYTNTTGHAIIASIALTSSGDINGGAVFIDGARVASGSQMARGETGYTVVIPAGSTYNLMLSFGTLYKWYEMRAD